MKKTGKLLFRYASYFKTQILIALLLLAFAVSAELAGPYIAKQMIDNNILGIEKSWYETTKQGKYAVPYEGHLYKRQDHFETGEEKGREVRVVQVGRHYFFVDEPIASGGARKIVDHQLFVDTDGNVTQYTAVKLSRDELYRFFKPEFNKLLLLAMFYFGLLILGAIFTFGQRFILQKSANQIIRRMRTDVFAHIQRLPIKYFDNLPAGKIVARVTNDTEAVRDLYVAVLANFFSGVIYMAAILGALFLLNYKLALIALPLVPLLFVWIIVYRKFATRYNYIVRTLLSDINAMINESIQGMPIIQAFRKQKQVRHEFEEMNHDYLKYQNKLLNLNSLTAWNLVNVIRNIIFISVIWLFAGDLLGTAVTVGVLYAFIDYMNRMFTPIVGIVNQLANMERSIVSAGRVFEVLEEPGIEVKPGSTPRYSGNVKFDHVSFAYKPGEDVLKDISFEAKQGQTVALVGHTGSGKSSIMNLLFRFYDVERGIISIDGQDVRDFPKQWLRHHMGIVLQDPFLFTGTIASNVSLNDPSISREMVVKALRDVGAYEMFMQLPRGIDEPVIEKGSTLSAGQRQLISFARALAFNPAILILDEATASIDTETETIIQSALEVLKKGRTTFIIAHRLSTIRSADLILVLDHGVIVERGTHEELLQLGGKYEQMYRLQLGERNGGAA